MYWFWSSLHWKQHSSVNAGGITEAKHKQKKNKKQKTKKDTDARDWKLGHISGALAVTFTLTRQWQGNAPLVRPHNVTAAYWCLQNRRTDRQTDRFLSHGRSHTVSMYQQRVYNYLFMWFAYWHSESWMRWMRAAPLVAFLLNKQLQITTETWRPSNNVTYIWTPQQTAQHIVCFLFFIYYMRVGIR